METQFLIGWICVAGALVGSASALGRRAASSERFAPPPPATAVDRAIGAIGMLAALASCEFAPKKIIVITALSDADIVARGGVPERAVVLRKPIALHDLEEHVRPT